MADESHHTLFRTWKEQIEHAVSAAVRAGQKTRETVAVLFDLKDELGKSYSLAFRGSVRSDAKVDITCDPKAVELIVHDFPAAPQDFAAIRERGKTVGAAVPVVIITHGDFCLFVLEYRIPPNYTPKVPPDSGTN